MRPTGSSKQFCLGKGHINHHRHAQFLRQRQHRIGCGTCHDIVIDLDEIYIFLAHDLHHFFMARVPMDRNANKPRFTFFP